VSKASKRERQRQNREGRRQRELQAQKRSGYFKTARNFGIVVALFAVIFIIVQVVNSNSGGKKTKSTTTTTAAKKTTTTSAATSTTAAATNTTATATTGARSIGPPPAGSPPLSIDPNGKYTATIDTSEGTITADLFAKDATWGANNFVTLARKGFYDGLGFHRAVKNFVIQGGDPKGDGSGGPGYDFVSEVPKTAYKVGDLAYAKTGSAPNGDAGSQFFVITSDKALATFNAKPYLYGDFGHVTGGLDVAKKIEALAPASGDGTPTKKVTIKKITIAGPAPTTAGK
jgi:cyclophilin family peptidyl-prolyl cis-trans isomerase